MEFAAHLSALPRPGGEISHTDRRFCLAACSVLDHDVTAQIRRFCVSGLVLKTLLRRGVTAVTSEIFSGLSGDSSAVKGSC